MPDQDQRGQGLQLTPQVSGKKASGFQHAEIVAYAPLCPFPIPMVSPAPRYR